MNAQLAPEPTIPQATALTPQAASATAAKVANDAAELAACIVVDSHEMYQLAAGELQTIVGQRKKIDDLRLSITRPMDEAKKRVMDLFRGPTEMLERAENTLKQSMLTFKRAEDARVARERAEAQRIAAEERAAAERARQQAEADAAAARRAAEEAAAAGDAATAAAAQVRVAQAEQVAVAAEAELDLADIAPVAVIEPAKATASGIGARKTYKAEVFDLKALVIAAAKAAEAGDDMLLGYLLANEKALNATARELKAHMRFPGVRVREEASLSVRAAAA